MASKTSLLLALAFAVVLLTTSEVVATKELASNRHGEVDHNYGGFNGNGVGRGGYNNGVGRGGYNSNGEVDHNYGGYNGNGIGRGGYNNNGVRGYNNDGIGRGGYNNNGGGRHGGCSYGCCGGGRYYLGGGCRCCSSFAEATAYKQTQS